ncbi:putative eukaryotic translation initiation factor 3 subunit CLU1/TIF31 [Myxozyma melibiosi]|uniref:Clustered mitochondria protein homolog n=1 Tax=Myxozyma melibiosi TaxID=54550 RepID=A0ABR1FD10_9ASCO
MDMLNLTVKLPHEPGSIRILVSVHETFNDIRQSILDLPSTVQYTCFSLWFNDAPLNDFLELSSVEGIHDGATLELHEEAYTEREARLHVLKVRDVIALSSTKNDPITALSSGLSALESVEAFGEQFKTAADEKDKTGPRHAMAGFDMNGTPSLAEILPQPEPAKPQCVKAFGLSVWHPPPANLRLRGHLLYLQVMTLEGTAFHITSHISGFYVSNSTSQKFDPTPKAKSPSAHSLLVLLQDLSPLFAAELHKWQTRLGERDPLTVYTPTNAMLAAPFIARPAPSPLPDVSRTQEQLLLGGSDNLDTVRDWNEDFQSTREMPRTTITERILRERLLNKLSFDYSEAAAKGAVQIVREEIPPMNTSDVRDNQVYLYNGILFSYGADPNGAYAKEGGDAAARYAVGKDLAGVKFVTQLDVEGLYPLCTVVVDYCGRRVVAQAPFPGIFRQQEDVPNQIVYGAVEERKVIDNSPDFKPYFEKIAESLHLKTHTVWDQDGKPFELATSLENKGLMGTDGRKYIIDLYRITPLDIEFLESEGEGYPHKMAVLRTEAVDEWWRVQVRAWVSEETEKYKAEGKEAEKESEEPVKAIEDSKAAPSEEQDGESVKEDAVEEKKEVVTLSFDGFKYAINPDVFAGQLPVTEADKEAYAEDEARVRAISKFVKTTLIPDFVKDIHKGTVSVPLDGVQLSTLMHKRGLNMRYLGAVLASVAEAEKESKTPKKFTLFKILLEQEIIARSLKHAISSLIRDIPVPLISFAVAHIYNSILGTKLNPDPEVALDEALVALYPRENLEFAKLSAKEIQDLVKAEAKSRFRYDLGENWVDTKVRSLQLFREVSIKMGFQWKAKDYSFDKTLAAPATEADEAKASEKTNGEQPVANGKSGKSGKKHGKKNKQAPKEETATVKKAVTPKATFVPDDLLNIVPVIKDSTMKSVLAEEAIEAGRISLIQGNREIGVDLLLESLSLHEQIYGILHPEVARAYSQLSMIYSSLEEKQTAAAAEYARKAVIIGERTLGFDSSETVLLYLNLALAEHANGNAHVALAHVRHAYTIWRIICGEDHPDAVTNLNNAAVMLQSLTEFKDSREWFEASLALCEKIFGTESVNTAALNFQLAQAMVLTQDSHSAVNRMKAAYTVFNAELGPEDRNTVDSEKWLVQLTQSAVELARQAKDLEARKAQRTAILNGTAKANVKPVGSAANAAAKANAGSSSGGRRSKTSDILNGVQSGEILPSAINTKSIEELVKYIGGTN